jgi:hypothetical protein
MPGGFSSGRQIFAGAAPADPRATRRARHLVCVGVTGRPQTATLVAFPCNDMWLGCGTRAAVAAGRRSGRAARCAAGPTGTTASRAGTRRHV